MDFQRIMWCQTCQENQWLKGRVEGADHSGLPGVVYTCDARGGAEIVQAETPHADVLKVGHKPYPHKEKVGVCCCGDMTPMRMEPAFDYGDARWVPEPFRCKSEDVPGGHFLVKFAI